MYEKYPPILHYYEAKKNKWQNSTENLYASSKSDFHDENDWSKWKKKEKNKEKMNDKRKYAVSKLSTKFKFSSRNSMREQRKNTI